MVAFGSGYYHWQPNNHTLVWDRLPMTIAFMALLSIAFGEFLSFNWAKKSFWSLICIGVGSIYYWYWGKKNGSGDLRPYILVQFLPIIILPILFIFGKSPFTSKLGYWLLLSAYILAKIAEYFDAAIYKLTLGLISGHSIKHILVAVGLYSLVLYFKKRSYFKLEETGVFILD